MTGEQPEKVNGDNLLWEKRIRPVLLWIILAAAFALRTYHNDAALPSIRIFDLEEDLIVERGMGIILGYTPALQWPGSTYFILYAILGGLVFFITHLKQLVFSLHGGMFEMIGVVDNFYVEFFRDPTLYYVVGRYFEAIISTASVYLVYRIGRELDDDKGGILGAILLALSPIGIHLGHIVNVDEMMNFILLAAFVMSIRYRRCGRERDIYMASVLTGLSAASKINGIFGLIMVVGALLGRGLSEKWSPFYSVLLKRLFGVLVFCMLGFILGCPYIITNPPAMAKFFVFSAALRVMLGNIQNAYVKIILDYLPQDIGWATMIAGTIGLAIFSLRRKGRELLIIFAALYYLFLGRIHTPSPWHPYPLACLMCLGTGTLLVYLYNRFEFAPRNLKIVIGAVFFVAVMAQPVLLARSVMERFTLEDTRVAAGHWIERNVPSGSRVLFTGHGNPRLYETRQCLERKLGQLSETVLIQSQYKRFREYVKIKGGSDWNRTLLEKDTFPFISFTQGFMVEEEFEKTRLRFLLADPNPAQPSYDVYEAQPLDIKYYKYIERLEAGKFDVLLIHVNESRGGPYGELREKAKKLSKKMLTFQHERGKRSGTPLELYVFGK